MLQNVSHNPFVQYIDKKKKKDTYVQILSQVAI